MNEQGTTYKGLKVSPLFAAVYNTAERVVVCQGGTSSGKTYAILQALLVIATTKAKQVITVVGQDLPNLRVGAWRDIKQIITSSDTLTKFCQISDGFLQVKCLNGSILEFRSFGDEQDARSGKRDYLFVNEANGVPFNIYWQLAIRTRKRVFVDYNPSARFWVHEKLIGTPGVAFNITDHRHNPFLTSEEHERIEGIKDKELWRVYARGLTGKIQGVIYDNVEVVDEMPTPYKGRWIGVDFGFNDPTAIVEVRLSGGKIWANEIAYKRGMTNQDIYHELARRDLLGVQVVADSAEPKSIEELRRLGVRVEAARKGADSIRAGIATIKRYGICVTRNSVNVRRELLNYKWKTDNTGEISNTPIDDFNHSLDALRYVALNKLQTTPRRASIKSGIL